MHGRIPDSLSSCYAVRDGKKRLKGFSTHVYRSSHVIRVL